MAPAHGSVKRAARLPRRPEPLAGLPSGAYFNPAQRTRSSVRVFDHAVEGRRMALSRHLAAGHIRSVGWAALLRFADPDHATAVTGARKARNVVLLTYRELITKQGLKAMRRPVG